MAGIRKSDLFFAPVELNQSSKRPVLSQNESILFLQKSVGIYDGNEKIMDYNNGVAYISTHRIMWLDEEFPEKKAIGIYLSCVSTWETTAGYLTRSPKIVIKLAFETPNDSSTSTSASTVDPTKEIECLSCTFLNFPGLKECEMCGTSLSSPNQNTSDSNKSASHPSYQPSSYLGLVYSPKSPKSSTSALSNADVTEIRLSFRAGGCEIFAKHLQTAVTNKYWNVRTEAKPNRFAASQAVTTSSNSESNSNVTVGGIAGIMRNVEQTNKEMDKNLNEAFQDLDALMTKASEMVKLAESISAKVGNSGNSSEINHFKELLTDLGIASPVTRETAGSMYIQVLSRQLAEILDKVLPKSGGMMSLTDIYCVFNRARGVALISPEDLYKACQQFEILKLPFRLRGFDSGLSVVQSIHHSDDSTAARVEAHVKQHPGITAAEIARKENISVVLAREQLLMTEGKGLICRDDTVEGLKFYENLFR
ncbi:Vacuolar protein-sorting-associated protein 36 [Nowakowskiella sp. JEL0407]|nr:Vacuolar protein-sorting-associated protein 36 [Nowakowskiella sp. JEL0407]